MAVALAVAGLLLGVRPSAACDIPPPGAAPVAAVRPMVEPIAASQPDDAVFGRDNITIAGAEAAMSGPADGQPCGSR